jgi:hypothetical protein
MIKRPVNPGQTVTKYLMRFRLINSQTTTAA